MTRRHQPPNKSAGEKNEQGKTGRKSLRTFSGYFFAGFAFACAFLFDPLLLFFFSSVGVGVVLEVAAPLSLVPPPFNVSVTIGLAAGLNLNWFEYLHKFLQEQLSTRLGNLVAYTVLFCLEKCRRRAAR
ncbi:hypothetical protein ARMGADRAFT_1033227 [Armillaria gallica]|uniref:Uncharacterized protein n=1 Tax=Armillaria gallica TaxID=47427 RepID=A0A2H3DN83_ARMGA|nr:hypothetical protein ARMGADRAFT_1033227 [Armillaria gallica]